MATVVTTTYATPAALTITLAGLASNAAAGQASTAVDNTTNKYVDAIVGGKITVGTTPTINTAITVWVYASYDGTSYAAGVTGTDAAFTPTQAGAFYMRLGLYLPVIATTSNVTHTFVLPSLVALYGSMPQKWGVFVQHNTVAALNATAGNHEIKYTGITYTST